MPGHFNLSFDQFETTTTNTFKDLLTDEQFTDVTLACADDKQIKAHKVILGSCSSILRNIIMTFPQQNPVIYLKGIKYEEMKSIIDFIYLGETKVKQELFPSFMELACELDIKGLAGEEANIDECAQSYIDEDHEKESEFVDETYGRMVKTEKHDTDKESCDKEIREKGTCEELLTESANHGSKPKTVKEAIYNCVICAKKFTVANNLKRHMQSQQHYEGVTYPCDRCDYKAMQPSHLKTHFTFKHSKVDKMDVAKEMNSLVNE